ncbi:kelch-like protein 30 [Palaemon carinicauda]|uniref:kelch-like protein 30 n=1 Tax=Palaemon carinicauda TaxID=392227 RepID=UPI0035B60600
MEQENFDVVILKADGVQFPCNKKKLIASSDYFRAMFSNNFSEKDKEVIILKDIDSECLKTLLEYAETGTYNIPSDCLALLQTAAMLQFTDIQLACEKEVFGSLSCESCLEIYSVTSSLGLLNIAKSARTIAVWNFRKIISTPKYLQLSLEALIEYLSDPSLFTGPNGEWTVWEAINSWIEEDEEERAVHIKDLMACLDFKCLRIDDISNMLFYNVISENDELVQILEGIQKYKRKQISHCSYLSGTDGDQTLDTSEKSSNSLDCDQSSECIELQESVDLFLNCLTRKLAVCPSVVGFKRLPSNQKKKAKNSDDDDDNICTSVSKGYMDVVPVLYVFNPSNVKICEEFPLTKLCHGPVLCSGFQVCSVGPSVYVLGGEYLYGHGNWNNSLWRYSTVTKKWIVEVSLPRPRRHHMLCVVDSVIYILGGFGRHRVVQSSVNAYDTETGEWLSCSDMPHCISNGAACAFKGRVMVFTHEMQLLTYYPSTKKWSAIPLMSPTKHGYRAALAWKNHIYLIDNCSTKVYKYSPEEGQNVVEYGYFLAPPINVCIVDGKIYSFTHDDLDYHVIEVLDIEDDLGNLDNTAASGRKIDEQIYSSEDRGDSSVADQHSIPRKVTKKVIASREVWKEGDQGPHIFTTKCPADVTFSLGCFPLMKL